MGLCRETVATGSHCARPFLANFSLSRENLFLPKMFRFVLAVAPLLLLASAAPKPQSHAEALAAHQAAENAVRAAAGQAPQAFSHEAALAAHAAAEQQVAALALLHPANPGVVSDTGSIGASGIVGSSGNIGSSGLCGPSGCVAFGK